MGDIHQRTNREKRSYWVKTLRELHKGHLEWDKQTKVDLLAIASHLDEQTMRERAEAVKEWVQVVLYLGGCVAVLCVVLHAMWLNDSARDDHKAEHIAAMALTKSTVGGGDTSVCFYVSKSDVLGEYVATVVECSQ